MADFVISIYPGGGSSHSKSRPLCVLQDAPVGAAGVGTAADMLGPPTGRPARAGRWPPSRGRLVGGEGDVSSFCSHVGCCFQDKLPDPRALSAWCPVLT